MTTIQDIANKAGVTKSTVSRYLNGGSVSKKTSEKIEQVIREENYVPSPFARSLKAKSSTIIGVIIPRVDSAATAHTLMGIEDCAKKLGYELLLANARQDNEREIQAIDRFARYKVAGIILIATEVTADHVAALNRADVPTVIVGQEHSAFHCVVHDDYEAGYELAEQLVTQGYETVTYVGVPERDRSVGVIRKSGVLDGAKAAHATDVRVTEGTFTIHRAVEIGTELFASGRRGLVIGATDNIAVGLMKAAHQAGLRIPEDVAIAGFGGYEVGQFMNPTLTTVRYHFDEAGQMAMEVMDHVLKHRVCPKEMVIPVEVELRESTTTAS